MSKVFNSEEKAYTFMLPESLLSLFLLLLLLLL
jgi:hypothetical protein